MKKEYLTKYSAIKRSLNHDTKKNAASLRKKHLESAVDSMVKIAFDTRRVNQDTDYIPRRNLQTYHRSEPFIDKAASETIKTFFKLKTAVDSIKEDFNGDPVWLDSYARILSCALDRTLRLEQKDFDFFKPQFDYLTELLYLRYRLRPEDIQRLGEKDIRHIVLDRDEKLLHKSLYANYNNGGMQKNSDNQPAPQIIKGDDALIAKLFGDVKASKDNKEVERSVTITIKDKIVDEALVKNAATSEIIKLAGDVEIFVNKDERFVNYLNEVKARHHAKVDSVTKDGFILSVKCNQSGAELLKRQMMSIRFKFAEIKDLKLVSSTEDEHKFAVTL